MYFIDYAHLGGKKMFHFMRLQWGIELGRLANPTKYWKTQQSPQDT
jgi:hypothetical protein